MELGNNQEVMQVEETSNDMGVLNRFINIIFEPAKVFESIIEKPKILAPFLTLIISLFILTIPILSVFEKYSIETNEKIYKSEKYLKTQNISKKNADKVIDMTAKYAKYGAFVVPVEEVLKYIISAALLFGLMKILGGQGTFKQTFAVVAYAGIIDIIGNIVKTISIVLTGNYDTTNSFAILMVNDKLNFFYDFISKLDLFSVWSLVITAIGLAVVHNIKKKKAYIAIFSLWFIYLLGTSVIVYTSAVKYYDKFGITL